ncbi:hypothetical protein C8R44DRAFT_873174 [Mycena epipterygia]|nr:hypothetical protein C8R44DRAFT_873174 [Mycena epipterygia]
MLIMGRYGAGQALRFRVQYNGEASRGRISTDVIDVDGMTFSGRFLGLLRSGSLVFKSTVFEEYFNDWLRPSSTTFR